MISEVKMQGDEEISEVKCKGTAMAPGSSSSRNGNNSSQQPRLQRQQQQGQVGPLSACDDRPEEQQQQDQVHKSMLSLVRYHSAVPKRLLRISYITSDDRASSTQEAHSKSLQGDRIGTSIDRASSAQMHIPSG